MNSEKTECIGIFGKILSFLSGITFIGIAIYETSVIDNNSGSKDDCWQIWPNILFDCIMNWTMALALMCGICSNDGGYFVISVSFVYSCFCGIWTIVIEENIDDDCADKYENDYPDLWDAFQMEVILFQIICCCGYYDWILFLLL
jgi:hypothetical protein